MESKTIAEALMFKLMCLAKGEEDTLQEVEILDADMRSFGQWRMIVWFRLKKGSKIADQCGTCIRTMVVHHNSFVEVIPDAQQPPVPQE